MSDLLTAARQALEFIQATNRNSPFFLVPESNLNKAITALRQAIEQAEQDSVTRNGWVLRDVLFDNGEPVGHREPEQEPLMDETDVLMLAEAHGIDAATVGLYSFYVDCMSATTPQRQPLTDEEIEACNKFTTDWGATCVWLWDDSFEEGGRQFARAVERAHGIGDQHE